MSASKRFAAIDQSIPALPSTVPAIPQIIQECIANPAGTNPDSVPNPQTPPTQEAGKASRPSRYLLGRSYKIASISAISHR
jgi:hypothetical protein